MSDKITPMLVLKNYCWKLKIEPKYELFKNADATTREYICKVTVGEHKGYGRASTESESKQIAARELLNILKFQDEILASKIDYLQELGQYNSDDPVGDLARYCEKENISRPFYEELPDEHLTPGGILFVICFIPGIVAYGKSTTMKVAKKHAAQKMLKLLKERRVKMEPLAKELEENQKVLVKKEGEDRDALSKEGEKGNALKEAGEICDSLAKEGESHNTLVKVEGKNRDALDKEKGEKQNTLEKEGDENRDAYDKEKEENRKTHVKEGGEGEKQNTLEKEGEENWDAPAKDEGEEQNTLFMEEGRKWDAFVKESEQKLNALFKVGRQKWNFFIKGVGKFNHFVKDRAERNNTIVKEGEKQDRDKEGGEKEVGNKKGAEELNSVAKDGGEELNSVEKESGEELDIVEKDSGEELNSVEENNDEELNSLHSAIEVEESRFELKKMSKRILPVAMLQSYCSKIGKTPIYDLRVSGTSIPTAMFVYRVRVGENKAHGQGPSKKEAKHAAAREMLNILKLYDRSLASEMCRLTEEIQHIPINAINDLFQYCSKKKFHGPNFEVEFREGAVYTSQYVVKCFVSELIAIGEGRKVKEAKQQAAYKMLNLLKEKAEKEMKEAPTEPAPIE